MVAALFNLVFYTINTVINIITKVIFSTTAYFFVQMFHAFKVPGEATKGILQHVAEILRSIIEYVFQLIIDVITTIITTIFDKLKDGLVEFIVSGSSAAGDLVDQTKTSLESLLSDVPEIIQGFAEMITTVVSDLWGNYMEAIGYVKENA